jgi:hypothetical protein
LQRGAPFRFASALPKIDSQNEGLWNFERWGADRITIRINRWRIKTSRIDTHADWSRLNAPRAIAVTEPS